MKKINFDEIKVTRKLGSGMLGTTYLAKYRNKTYALKIQHILEKDVPKNFKSELWRELDVYKYISKLSRTDKLFFTSLHGYDIYNQCEHIQKRPFDIDNADAKNEFIKRLKKLDESDWCVKYLMDYKGHMTLQNYLIKYKPSPKVIYSVLSQICKIIYTLYLGGYSHNDLHPGNIMVNKTDRRYFDFMDNKIPYHGLQISAIDFGEVLHKKFGIKYTRESAEFLVDREMYMFHEMFYACINVINNTARLMNDCVKQNKKMAWENIDKWSKGRLKIIKNHREFVNVSKYKYIDIFPKSKRFFDYMDKRIDSAKYIEDIPKKHKDSSQFWHVINRVLMEFSVFFPEKYSKYVGWCSWYDCPLPKEDVQKILVASDYLELVYTIIHLSKKQNDK